MDEIDLTGELERPTQTLGKITYRPLDPKPRHGRPEGYRERWVIEGNGQEQGYLIEDPQAVNLPSNKDGQLTKVRSFVVNLGGKDPARFPNKSQAKVWVKVKLGG